MQSVLIALMVLTTTQPVCSVTLHGKTASVVVPFEATAGQPAILHLDGVQAEEPPGGYYEVHAGGEFAGNITFYGVTPEMSRDLTFRISGSVAKGRNGRVAVKFVPRGGAARSGARVHIRALRIANS